jgi:lipopolysaccharide heptosyltransferase II
MSIVPPIATDDLDVAVLTGKLNSLLEAQVRRAPADWFWVHNRWKTPQPKFLLATYKRGVAVADSHARLKPFRILIRASNWLGDAVMSVKAVRAIKAGRPDAHVTILTQAKLAEFWRAVAGVDEVIAIENSESVFQVARKIRRDFEVAVIFPNSFRTALEAWLAQIPRRVGYPGHRRHALLNQVFPEKKRAQQKGIRHQTHEYLQLAEFIGAEVQPAIFAETRSAERVVSAPIIGLCPGAEYGGAKRWLPERFAEVMREIVSGSSCEWRIFGVEKDRMVADAIIAAAAVPCIDLVGKTSLSGLMSELRGCDVLLTNDTGTMHLAAFLGVPTVALFGSTEPALTAPLGPNHQIIRHHVECSPCFLRECPIDFRCMKAITVQEVVAAIERVLGEIRASVAA